MWRNSLPERRDDRDAVLDATGGRARSVPGRRGLEYADGVLDMLSGPAKDLWRERMATSLYRYQSDFARGYEAAGEAWALLLMLKARQLPVSDEALQRIRILHRS
jgi:hypothetical protein